MSTQDKARQNATEQRLHVQHRQQSMLERIESEVADANDAEIQEETRESLTRQRRKEQHRVQTMKHRSEEEIDNSDQATSASEPS